MVPEQCPVCGEPAMRRPGPHDLHHGHALYRCGSTTMMLADGMHARRDEPREVALWRQRLVATSRSGLDPML